MKKKIFGGIAVLVIAVVAAWNVNVSSRTNGMSNVMLANVEALGGECIAGGTGSSGCSIEGGLDILGNGGSIKCSVDCTGGYYACCSLSGCHCEQY